MVRSSTRRKARAEQHRKGGKKMADKSRNDRRLKRHARVRKHVFGTPEKPRMCVFRSNANISVQIIDDVNGDGEISIADINAIINMILSGK